MPLGDQLLEAPPGAAYGVRGLGLVVDNDPINPA
jgi:hypothetical protein